MQMKPNNRSKLTLYIGIALLAGIIAGFILNKNYVGEENNKIANAEIQLTHIDKSMLPFESIKDSVAYNSFQTKKNILAANKKNAETNLLSSPDETSALANNKVLADSIKLLQIAVANFTDTNTAAYKILQTQREQIVSQKNVNLKIRDAKLEWLTILADIFLRLIKMIVAPLVFTTLVVGVAKLGDIKSVGRIGGKTLLWFFSASLLSLLLGMLLVNIFEPGRAMHLPLPDSHVSTGIDKAALTVKDFFTTFFQPV